MRDDVADERSGTFYVHEEDPPSNRPRWYGHLDGTDPPEFDSVDDAVAWGLQRARGVVIRTVQADCYLAGEEPVDRAWGMALRPWPPSAAEKRQIEADYQSALEAEAEQKAIWRAYEAARDGWLAQAAPGRRTAPTHESSITLPESHEAIWFEEFDTTGQLCGGAIRDGRYGFGTTLDVLVLVTGRLADDPWIRAVVAALEREREWADGRRNVLEVYVASGEMFHVSASANRRSIAQRGLDWRLMERPGVAGSQGPEVDGIFLCESAFDVEFFTDMARVPSDVWAVDVRGRWVESGPTGWVIVLEPIPASAVRLVRRDVLSTRR